VLQSPAPSVFFTGFGASSLDFEVHAHVDGFEKRLQVQHELNRALDEALRANGIGIAGGAAVPAETAQPS